MDSPALAGGFDAGHGGGGVAGAVEGEGRELQHDAHGALLREDHPPAAARTEEPRSILSSKRRMRKGRLPPCQSPVVPRVGLTVQARLH